MRLIEQPGKITGGQFLLNGQNILNYSPLQMENTRGGKMAMIFQEPMTALNPVLTIGYQMDEQIKKHLKLSKKDLRQVSKRTRSIFFSVSKVDVNCFS